MMSIDEEYISVSDFADRVGVSQQAIYKKMKTTSFKPFIKEFKTGKRLNIKALKLFEEENIKPVVEPIQPFQPTDSTSLKDEFNDHLLKEIEYLKLELEKRDSQLKIKDQQIESLLKMNENNQILLKTKEESSNQLMIETVAKIPSSDVQVSKKRWFKDKNVG